MPRQEGLGAINKTKGKAKSKSALTAWSSTADADSGRIQIGEIAEAHLIDAVNACLVGGVYLGLSATRDGRSIKITAMHGGERGSVYASNDDELVAKLEELAALASTLEPEAY
jgi:hypothetical protein